MDFDFRYETFRTVSQHLKKRNSNATEVFRKLYPVAYIRFSKGERGEEPLLAFLLGFRPLLQFFHFPGGGQMANFEFLGGGGSVSPLGGRGGELPPPPRKLKKIKIKK